MPKISKNIIIFADGTGQSEDGQYKTNVLKLSRLVKKASAIAKQRVFYDPGVGLGLDMMGKMIGRGLSENVRQCYSEICKHYEEGDRIYLFGFSRGAATVASLANFLALFGCLDVDASYEKNLAAAWKIYKGSNRSGRRLFFAKNIKQKIARLNVWAFGTLCQRCRRINHSMILGSMRKSIMLIMRWRWMNMIRCFARLFGMCPIRVKGR